MVMVAETDVYDNEVSPENAKIEIPLCFERDLIVEKD
jgi:hypothetical protein